VVDFLHWRTARDSLPPATPFIVSTDSGVMYVVGFALFLARVFLVPALFFHFLGCERRRRLSYSDMGGVPGSSPHQFLCLLP